MKKNIFAILLLFVSGYFLYAKGIGENKLPQIEVTGRVRLVGSGLINDLVITTEEKEWYIDQNDRQKLWQLQQQTVTVKGKEYYQDLVFANGTPAGRQYFLKDITILKRMVSE